MALFLSSKKTNKKGNMDGCIILPKSGNVNRFICNFCKSITFYRNAARMKCHLSSCLKCPKKLCKNFKTN